MRMIWARFNSGLTKVQDAWCYRETETVEVGGVKRASVISGNVRKLVEVKV
jgi:hypothetical protein